MTFDVSTLTTVQLTALAAVLAAVVAGTFGLVSALINGWNVKRQARDNAIRQYRLCASEELLQLARRRVNSVYHIHSRSVVPGFYLGIVPAHEDSLKLFYPDGFDARTIIAFRMSCPFVIRNMALRFQAADIELLDHLRKSDADDPGRCAHCELFINHLGKAAAAMHKMLEDFIFYGSRPNTALFMAKWWYLDRRYQKLCLKNQLFRASTTVSSARPTHPVFRPK